MFKFKIIKILFFFSLIFLNSYIYSNENAILIEKGSVEKIKKEMKTNPDFYRTRIGTNDDTILMHAIRFNRPQEIIDLILKSGTNVYWKNKFNQTALSYTCKYSNNEKVIDLLFSKFGSEKKIQKELFKKDKTGLSPFDYSKENYFPAIKNYLSKYSVPENTETSVVNTQKPKKVLEPEETQSELQNESTYIEQNAENLTETKTQNNELIITQNTDNIEETITEELTPTLQEELNKDETLITKEDQNTTVEQEVIQEQKQEVTTELKENQIQNAIIENTIAQETEIKQQTQIQVPSVVSVPLTANNEPQKENNTNIVENITKISEDISSSNKDKEINQELKEEQITLTKEIKNKENKQIENPTTNDSIQKNIITVEPSKYKKILLYDYAPQEEEIIIEEKNTTHELAIIPEPNKKDKNGVTKLMNAAKTGNNWAIDSLLKSGADVTAKDKEGWTALMYAIRYQSNIEIINTLINHGSKIKDTNNYGTSVLQFAATYSENPEILKKVLSYYVSSDKEIFKSFILTLSNPHVSIDSQKAKLQIFIDRGISLNRFYEGKTPLMYASEYAKSTSIIKLLLDNGAVASIRTSNGKTAFDFALTNTHLQQDETYWLLNNNR